MRFLRAVTFPFVAALCSCSAPPLVCDPLMVDLYDAPDGGTTVIVSCGVDCATWKCDTDPKSRLVTCRCDGRVIAKGEAWVVQ